MIRPIALIAAREYRQIAASRGFWLTLLIVPLLLAIGSLAGDPKRPGPDRRVMLIDPDGRFGHTLSRALRLSDDRPRFELVAPPANLARASPDRIAAWMAAPGERPDELIYIPPRFAEGTSPLRIWTGVSEPDALIDRIQAPLRSDLQAAAMAREGLTPDTAERISRLTPRVRIEPFRVSASRVDLTARATGPLFIAYGLFMALMLSGSWMLQGLVEERSNKLIESLLACVRPSDLFYGKLVGTAAVGLTLALSWLGCALVAGFTTGGPQARAISEAAAALADPLALVSIAYFFVTGYLMVATILLAIGALSDSFRDAQAYLGPVMLVIVMPFALVASTLLTTPDAPIVRAMGWIPLYAPFVMIARTGSGIPWWELLGSALLLALFVAAELALVGRLFRTSLLASGQRPSLARLLHRIRRHRPD